MGPWPRGSCRSSQTLNVRLCSRSCSCSEVSFWELSALLYICRQVPGLEELCWWHQDGLDPFPGGCKGCAIGKPGHPSVCPSIRLATDKYLPQALKSSRQGLQTSPQATDRETPPWWDPSEWGSGECRQRKRRWPTN